MRNLFTNVIQIIKEKRFIFLNKFVISLNTYNEINNLFKWTLNPIINDQNILDYQYIEDVNQRRLRDAESICSVARNIMPKTCLEIGTGTGHITSLIAINAPDSLIYTVNLTLRTHCSNSAELSS